MLELLALESPTPVDSGAAFLLGLLSHIDSMLGYTLRQINMAQMEALVWADSTLS